MTDRQRPLAALGVLLGFALLLGMVFVTQTACDWDECYKEGRVAARVGEPLESCPHKDRWHKRAWQEGWLEGRQ